MDFMLVCLSLWVGLTHKHTHTHNQSHTGHTHEGVGTENGSVCVSRSDDERWELACVRH